MYSKEDVDKKFDKVDKRLNRLEKYLIFICAVVLAQAPETINQLLNML